MLIHYSSEYLGYVSREEAGGIHFDSSVVAGAKTQLLACLRAFSNVLTFTEVIKNDCVKGGKSIQDENNGIFPVNSTKT